MKYVDPPDWYTYLDRNYRRTTKDKAVYRQWFVIEDDGSKTLKIEEMPRNTYTLFVYKLDKVRIDGEMSDK